MARRTAGTTSATVPQASRLLDVSEEDGRWDACATHDAMARTDIIKTEDESLIMVFVIREAVHA